LYVSLTFPARSIDWHGTVGSLEELITHGLHALRETLQQDKELNVNNTSIGILGPASAHETSAPKAGAFRILEGESLEPYLKTMVPKEDVPPPAPPAGGAPVAAGDDVEMAG
jgi:20S proteasome subunit alpha 6